MQTDDEDKILPEKEVGARDSSWLFRAFNPPGYAPSAERANSYKFDFKRKPPNKIGDTAKLLHSPVSTKKILSFVVGEETAGKIYSMVESITLDSGEHLRRAALSNWFIQPETPAPFIETLKACTNDEASIRDAFAGMMRLQLENICDRLKKDFPKRAHIINEGFALHKERRFLASIPLFLMMAEGIATEKSGKSIFSPGPGTEKGHQPPQIFRWLEKQNLSSVAKVYSSALQIEHPFSRRERKGQLSRHAVLHGNSLEYGTEIFSLQTISILGLVGWVFSEDGLVFASRRDVT